MDLVSFETEEEWNLVRNLLRQPLMIMMIKMVMILILIIVVTLKLAVT